MKWLLPAVILIAALAPHIVRADLDEGDLAPDIDAKEWLNTDEPVSIAELRGMVVVLFFWVSFHEGGESVLPLMTLLENNETYGRRAGVYYLGVTDADRKRMEEQLQKAKIFFPVALESKAHEEYEIESFPRAVILDPTGKVAWTGWPGGDGGDGIANAVLEAIADTPPTRTHPRESAEALKYLDEAESYIRDGNYRKAYVAARAANERALRGDPLKSKCQQYLDLVEAVAQDLLFSGEREIIANKFNRGVEYFVRASREFRGMESSRQARRKLKLLAKENEAIQKVIDEQARETAAYSELAAAIDEVRQQKFGDAFARLETIVKDNRNSGAAEDAIVLMDRLQSDPRTNQVVLDFQARAECEPILSQARTAIAQRKYTDAKRKLEGLVRKHPDTTYAVEARKMLINLP